MYSFALVNGDLALGQAGYLPVSGGDKIRQDLGLALREQFGSDPYHLQWGSQLGSYVGLPLTNDVTQRIIREATRVVNNYIKVQNSQIEADRISVGLSRLDSSGIVKSLESVTVKQKFDTAYLNITLTALDNQSLTVQEQMSI